MRRPIPTAAFTMIEVMVVVTIVSVLSAVLYASFDGSRAGTRDSVRQTDLKQLQLAIELYRAQNGRYPERGCGITANWVGPGPHPAGWGSECEEYIAGLVPDFIAELPTDPTDEEENNIGFIYRTDTNGTSYKVLIHQSVERKEVDSYDDSFARCPYDCGNAACGASPQPRVYGVYSAGAECW